MDRRRWRQNENEDVTFVHYATTATNINSWGPARTQSLLPKITHPKQPPFADVASVNLSRCNERPLLGGASFVIKAVPQCQVSMNRRPPLPNTLPPYSKKILVKRLHGYVCFNSWVVLCSLGGGIFFRIFLCVTLVSSSEGKRNEDLLRLPSILRIVGRRADAAVDRTRVSGTSLRSKSGSFVLPHLPHSMYISSTTRMQNRGKEIQILPCTLINTENVYQGRNLSVTLKKWTEYSAVLLIDIKNNIHYKETIYYRHIYDSCNGSGVLLDPRNNDFCFYKTNCCNRLNILNAIFIYHKLIARKPTLLFHFFSL